MCRLPEIVEDHRSLIVGGPGHWHVDGGYSYLGSTKGFTEEGPNWYIAYKCINCDRQARTCPLCKELRCDSDMAFTDPGHFKLACTTCRPDGVGIDWRETDREILAAWLAGECV